MAAIDFPAQIKDLRGTFASIEQVSDVEGLQATVAALSEEAAAPNLWDDPEAAQKVTSRLSHKQSGLDRLGRLRSRLEDLETRVELAQEEDDPDLLGEAGEELESVRKALAELARPASIRRRRRGPWVRPGVMVEPGGIPNARPGAIVPDEG